MKNEAVHFSSTLPPTQISLQKEVKDTVSQLTDKGKYSVRRCYDGSINMRSTYIFLIAGVLLMLPYAAYAAFQLVPCTGPECQACHVVQLASNIVTFLISIAAGIGAIMFAIAGLQMATSRGNESKVTAAKGMMTNVVVGFIILMASWLIVDTVMKQFVTDSQFGTWNNIQCVSIIEYSREGDAPGAVTSVTAEDIGLTGVSGSELSDAVIRTKLAEAGIRVVSSGNCSDSSKSNCTSLTGMNTATVDQILEIKKACGCDLVVTGGTEAGHASGPTSHANGYKVDIDDGNATLNSYLESKLTDGGVRTGSHGGKIYKDKCGNEYVKESSHWDITVTSSCSL